MPEVTIQLGDHKYAFPDQQTADRERARYEQAVLGRYPSNVQALARKMATYDLPVPSGMAISRPNSPWNAALQAASELDPSFSAAEYPSRLQLMKDFGSGGKHSDMIRQFNNAIQHLNQLHGAIGALHNTPVEALNGLLNWGEQKFLDDPRPKAFDVPRTFLSEELPKAVRGGQTSEKDVEAILGLLNRNEGPNNQKEGVKRALEILQSQVGNLSNQFFGGNAPPPQLAKRLQFLYPQSRQALVNMGVDPSKYELGGPGAATPPAQPAPQQPAQGQPQLPPLESFWNKQQQDDD